MIQNALETITQATETVENIQKQLRFRSAASGTRTHPPAAFTRRFTSLAASHHEAPHTLTLALLSLKPLRLRHICVCATSAAEGITPLTLPQHAVLHGTLWRIQTLGCLSVLATIAMFFFQTWLVKRFFAKPRR